MKRSLPISSTTHELTFHFPSKTYRKKSAQWPVSHELSQHSILTVSYHCQTVRFFLAIPLPLDQRDEIPTTLQSFLRDQHFFATLNSCRLPLVKDHNFPPGVVDHGFSSFFQRFRLPLLGGAPTWVSLSWLCGCFDCSGRRNDSLLSSGSSACYCCLRCCYCCCSLPGRSCAFGRAPASWSEPSSWSEMLRKW